MPKRAAASSLAQLVDPLSEDDFQQSDLEMMPTPDSSTENIQPPKRGKSAAAGASKTRPRTANATAGATRIAKKPAARRTSGASLLVTGGAGTKRRAATTSARAALAEQQNPAGEGEGSEDEGDDFDATQEEIDVVERPAKAVKRAPSRSRARTTIPAGERNGRPAPRRRAKREVIEEEEEGMEAPEDGEEMMAMDVTEDEDESLVAELVQPALRSMASATTVRARSTSQQPLPSGRHKRMGSASDSERASDPMLRRRNGELTKKLEALELKYRNLREVGMRDSESNFDRLRRSTDQRAKDQDELIASLRRELSLAKSASPPSASPAEITALTTQLAAATTQNKSLSAQLHDLTSQNHSLTAENQRLTAKLDALSADSKSLTVALQAAKSENKSLAAKLASTRASSAPAETGKPPPSAIKAPTLPPPTGSMSVGPAARGGRAAAAELAERERELLGMRVKEELYSDLTGLMIRSVKRGEEGEDVFDCIQTGPNGTLRFHLHVPNSPSKGGDPPTSGGAAYEEDEIGYTPLLDAKNDGELLEILPDYLMEEICFPRASAARFYGRVMACMNARVEEA